MVTPAHVAAALGTLNDVAGPYQVAREMYEGTSPEIMTNRRLAQLLGDAGQQYRINYARTPVDVLLERTEIQGITCSDGGTQTILETAWEANELGLEAKDVHRIAYEFGDSYLIAWPDDELEGRVSAYTHTPESVRVFYDPQRPRQKASAVHVWLEPGDEENELGEGTWRRVDIYLPDRVEQYVSEVAVVDAYGQRRVVNQKDDDYRLLDELSNETGIIPVFHFRTGRPYGRPEHADAYGPQHAINKLLVSMMASVDYQIGPQRYVLTESALEPSRQGPSPDDVFGDVPTEAGLSQQSDMESGPGTAWLLSGKNVRVGQFDPASMANFLDPIHSLVKQMATVTDISVDRYDQTGAPQSGESRRLGDVPLNKKADDRQAQFGVTWHEFFDYVAKVNGRPDAADAQVAWAPPETYNDLTSWQSAQLQVDAGVPKAQVLLERGYSTDVVSEWGVSDKPEEPEPEPEINPPVVVAEPVV